MKYQQNIFIMIILLLVPLNHLLCQERIPPWEEKEYAEYLPARLQREIFMSVGLIIPYAEVGISRYSTMINNYQSGLSIGVDARKIFKIPEEWLWIVSKPKHWYIFNNLSAGIFIVNSDLYSHKLRSIFLSTSIEREWFDGDFVTRFSISAYRQRKGENDTFHNLGVGIGLNYRVPILKSREFRVRYRIHYILTPQDGEGLMSMNGDQLYHEFALSKKF